MEQLCLQSDMVLAAFVAKLVLSDAPRDFLGKHAALHQCSSSLSYPAALAAGSILTFLQQMENSNNLIAYIRMFCQKVRGQPGGTICACYASALLTCLGYACAWTKPLSCSGERPSSGGCCCCCQNGPLKFWAGGPCHSSAL